MRQVSISTNTIAAMASGSQPPWITFSVLDDRKARSTRPSAPNTAKTTGRRQCHWRIATTATRKVLITITPVTAMP